MSRSWFGPRPPAAALQIFAAAALLSACAAGGGSAPDSALPVVGEQPAALAAIASETVIIVMGDSITAGLGVQLEEAYPALLEARLRAEGHAVRVVNSGVSGETTAGGLRRADFIARQKGDIVIVALGGNDALRGIDPAAAAVQLESIINILAQSGARVVLAGMYAPHNLGSAYVGSFDAMYPALAKKYALPLVPFLLEGVALDPALNQPDGIHPTPAGQRIIMEQNIYPVIIGLLK
ncbi:esterase TesA [Anaerolineaceae bacterium]|nr:esterase TesA [Anaerolineaceae bacterium]